MPEIQEVKIEKLVYGGDGLGRLESGEVIFIPWSVPGDRLAIQRLPDTGKTIRGEIEKILEPGFDRMTPACSVFGTCGGCQWQQITPSAQRQWKRTIVEESLTRIGKLKDISILETLGSDETAWRYRNRVQWDITPDGRLGYCKTESHEVVSFEDCRIIPEALNRIASWLTDKLRKDAALAKRMKRVEAFINRQEQILVLFEPQPGQELNRLATALKTEFPAIIGIVSQAQPEALPPNAPAGVSRPVKQPERSEKQTPATSTPSNRPPAGVARQTASTSLLSKPAPEAAKLKTLEGQAFITETLGGQTFRISAGSFFQTNITAAEQILALLDTWTLSDATSLIDLFAGVGVFAIHFASKFQQILAIESAETAMADAQANLHANNIQHVALKTGDVSRVLRNLKGNFDVAVVDPPRAGCRPEVLHWLNEHVQRQILYVSCNPTTLARDLRTLTNAGWQIQAVQPIDMFPQTYHVETIVNLTR